MGQRREIRIRCLFVSFVLRDESEEGIEGGERGMGRGQRKARILSVYRRYPIKVPFLYTINVLRVTCMDDEIGPISILVSLRD